MSEVTEIKAGKLKELYETQYKILHEEIIESVVLKQLKQLGEIIWDDFSSLSVIDKVVFNPVDSLNGSLSIYIKSMPGGFFLRVWYNVHTQKFMTGIFKEVVGSIAHLIPQTFNESGLFEMASLDKFADAFVTILTKEEYNQVNKITFL